MTQLAVLRPEPESTSPDAMTCLPEGHGLAGADAIEPLFAEHAAAAHQIHELARVMNVPGGLGDVVNYFIEGNAGNQSVQRSLYISKLFRTERALRALDAAFWRRALDVTNLYELLPEERRQRWANLLDAWKKAAPGEADQLPPFEPVTVRKTIAALLMLRPRYLAERVDGVFNALSGFHSTNLPQGFGKRMILAGVYTEHGHVDHHMAGHVADLRGTVAKFWGDPDPTHNETEQILERALNQAGNWLAVDGHSLRVRAYRAGTLHVEVHPDIARRLNAVLGALHPHRIPEGFSAPRRSVGASAPLRRPLPFPVRYLLSTAGIDPASCTARLSALFPKDEFALPAARLVLEMLGAVPIGDDVFRFSTDPRPLLDSVDTDGLPCARAVASFTPSIPALAAQAVALAQIGEEDVCLEPSAGAGNLAQLLPLDRTTMVEQSAVHCAHLRASGLRVCAADFLAWACAMTPRFSRIVMHPPHGQWQTHLAAAASLALPAARLVAILPAGTRGEAVALLGGWNCMASAAVHTVRDANYPGLELLCAQR